MGLAFICRAVELAEKIDIWAGQGVHPHDAKDVDGGMEQELIAYRHPKVVAISEVGLDTTTTTRRNYSRKFPQTAGCGKAVEYASWIHSGS